ncbi:MAG: hypothetical protein WA192_17380 [Candidatus Acidiferrales bacterium]
MATAPKVTDEEKSSARPALLLLLAVFVVAGFSVKFGLQTLTWVEGKLWTSADPWLANVPQPLPPPVAAAKGERVKAFNYEFDSPWPGNPKSTGTLTYTTFRYESGPVVVFFDPDSQVDTVRALKSSNPIEYQRFASVFADHPIETNFAMYQAVYGASPTQLSPLMSVREAMRVNVLLLWKLSFGLDLLCDGQFYSFQTDKLKGFQFGNPEMQRPVAVRAFDDRDRQFRFIFTTAAGSAGHISQNDINSVLQTFQSVPLIER